MEANRVCVGSSNMALVHSSEVLDSLWLPNSSPSFHGDSGSGSSAMVNFTNVQQQNKSEISLFPQFSNNEDTGNDNYDQCFHHPEKKRRLTLDQVHFLEKNFEVENKLEPDRKVQLAKELGLQPRQVAIWFQNRRARFKNKQLEKDYDALKARYDKLETDCESLSKEKENLKNEVHLLTKELVHKEKGKANSEEIDPINEKDEEAKMGNPCEIAYKVPIVICAKEEAISAKSDVLDSDSPQCTDGKLLEPADSSNVLEPEQSDSFSHDEEDNFSRGFLHPLCFPKIEYDDFPIDPPLPNPQSSSSSSCYLNFPVEESPSWFWSY